MANPSYRWQIQANRYGPSAPSMPAMMVARVQDSRMFFWSEGGGGPYGDDGKENGNYYNGLYRFRF